MATTAKTTTQEYRAAATALASACEATAAVARRREAAEDAGDWQALSGAFSAYHDARDEQESAAVRFARARVAHPGH